MPARDPDEWVHGSDREYGEFLGTCIRLQNHSGDVVVGSDLRGADGVLRRTIAGHESRKDADNDGIAGSVATVDTPKGARRRPFLLITNASEPRRFLNSRGRSRDGRHRCQMSGRIRRLCGHSG